MKQETLSRKAAYLSSVAVIVAAFATIMIYSVFGYSTWWNYESVEPKDTINIIGSDLVMISTREVKRNAKIQWIDTLRCESIDSGIYSQSTVSGEIKETELGVKPWVYGGELPNTPDTCFMHSIVKKEKFPKVSQVIISGPIIFEYGNQ